MKRLTGVLVLALLLTLSWMGLAAYTYFYSENLASPNWSNWISYVVSSTWYSAGGYGGITGNGYMLYSPSYLSQGEVKIRVRLDPSAAYGAFDALISAVEGSGGDMPTFCRARIYANGSSGSLSVLKRDNWTETQLGSTAITPHDNMVVRMVRRTSGSTDTLLVYLDDSLKLELSTPYLSGYRGGAGVSADQSSYPGSVVSNVDLGALDTTSPNAISSGSITATPSANHVDIQWPTATDNTNGIGVALYKIYRGGVLLGSTTGLTFSDTTVVPSTTYTYTLTVMDFHGNTASTNFNVTTPGVGTNPPFPSATPEGRRVGVRPTGAYWGASGENIDTLSGNLNFTLPLVKAQGRGGWGVGFNLTYNSQNWRWDGSSNWIFGKDVGYGFGWRVLAGSITPVWADPYTVSYYLFTDSTGAEYRLDQNSSNIWTSKESIYVSFDATTNKLYFRDGSFWYFGCVSAPGEADMGIMYPTLMQDTNGNQIKIRYRTGSGGTWDQSSARIKEIEDVRGVQGTSTYRTFAFTYNSDTPPPPDLDHELHQHR